MTHFLSRSEVSKRYGRTHANPRSDRRPRISGKIFAFPKDGELILKRPSSRVAELIESGVGRPWGPGAKVMKEWVAVSAAASELWPPLVEEAKTFVGSE